MLLFFFKAFISCLQTILSQCLPGFGCVCLAAREAASRLPSSFCLPSAPANRLSGCYRRLADECSLLSPI